MVGGYHVGPHMDLAVHETKLLADSRIRAEKDTKYDKKNDDSIHPSTSGGKQNNINKNQSLI